MEEFRKNKQAPDEEPLKTAPLNAETSYPSAIEKMSEKWRAIRQDQPDEQQSNFAQRNFLTVGIGIALLIIALLIVIGGFAFLVWNAQ